MCQNESMVPFHSSAANWLSSHQRAMHLFPWWMFSCSFNKPMQHHVWPFQPFVVHALLCNYFIQTELRKTKRCAGIFLYFLKIVVYPHLQIMNALPLLKSPHAKKASRRRPMWAAFKSLELFHSSHVAALVLASANTWNKAIWYYLLQCFSSTVPLEMCQIWQNRSTKTLFNLPILSFFACNAVTGYVLTCSSIMQ